MERGTHTAGTAGTAHPMRARRRTRHLAFLARARAFVVDIVVDLLLLLVLAVIVWVVASAARDILAGMISGSTDGFKELTVELLTVFVLVEIFHSLAEYSRMGRVRVTHLTDASLAFVLREVWIGMYAGDIDWPRLLAMAAMVLALGGVRTLAVLYSPGECAADVRGGL